jgi:hypothetical protein
MGVASLILIGIAAEVGAAVDQEGSGKADNRPGRWCSRGNRHQDGRREKLASTRSNLRLEPDDIKTLFLQAEYQMPELIALYAAGVEGQFALLQAETREGFWQSFWRYGWMYLLAIFWIWRIIVAPIVNQRLEALPAA